MRIRPTAALLTLIEEALIAVIALTAEIACFETLAF
jgi:hypothetical protein